MKCNRRYQLRQKNKNNNFSTCGFNNRNKTIDFVTKLVILVNPIEKS